MKRNKKPIFLPVLSCLTLILSLFFTILTTKPETVKAETEYVNNIPDICLSQQNDFGRAPFGSGIVTSLHYNLCNETYDTNYAVHKFIGMSAETTLNLNLQLATLNWYFSIPRYDIFIGAINNNDVSIRVLAGTQDLAYDPNLGVSYSTEDQFSLNYSEGDNYIENGAYSNLSISITSTSAFTKFVLPITITLPDYDISVSDNYVVGVYSAAKSLVMDNMYLDGGSYASGCGYFFPSAEQSQKIVLKKDAPVNYNLTFSSSDRYDTNDEDSISFSTTIISSNQNILKTQKIGESSTLLIPVNSGKISITVHIEYVAFIDKETSITNYFDTYFYDVLVYGNDDYYLSVGNRRVDDLSTVYLTQDEFSIFELKFTNDELNEVGDQLTYRLYLSNEQNVSILSSSYDGYVADDTPYIKGTVTSFSTLYYTSLEAGTYKVKLEIFDPTISAIDPYNYNYENTVETISNTLIATTENVAYPKMLLDCADTIKVNFSTSNEDAFFTINILNYTQLGSISMTVVGDTIDGYLEGEQIYIYGFKEGVSYIFIENKYSEYNIETKTIKVISTLSDAGTYGSSFVEGNSISLILNENSFGQELSLEESMVVLDVPFTFLSLDESVVKVFPTSNTTVLILPVAEGSGTVIAYYKTQNGHTITASIDVNVLTSYPEIGIKVSKFTNATNLASMTIYDLLYVQLSSGNFVFSKDTSYTWYLDGEEITTVLNNLEQTTPYVNSSDFYLKLSEGQHTLSVTVNDAQYDFELSASQGVSITSIVNAERTLSISYGENVYAILNQHDIKLDVLLDGVIDTNYDYTWVIDDTTIASVAFYGNHSVLITPHKAGSTIINVFTNIGLFGESKIIRTQITLVIEELNSVKITSHSDFTYPNNDNTFYIEVNGRRNVPNFEYNLTVKNDGVVVSEDAYEIKDGVITFENMEKGKYRFELSYDNQTYSKSFDVTNFNLKMFLKIILPYLLFVATIVLALFFLTKKVRNPLYVITRKINNLEEKTKKLLNNKKDKNHFSIRNLYFYSRHIQGKIDYYYDEGYDEFKELKVQIRDVSGILFATYKSKVDNKTQLTSLSNLLDNQIDEIKHYLKTIKIAREKFEDALRKNNSGEKTIKKNKKVKKTTQEYVDFLKKQLHDRSGTDDDSDEAN